MLIVGDYILELFLLADPLASTICFAGEMRLLDFFLGILAFFYSSFGLLIAASTWSLAIL